MNISSNNDNIMAFVMAGGQGERLRPLTDTRSKPAVPFGSRHRIVDFVLSNLVNSQIFTIYLLVQYKSQSLIEHVRKAWQLSTVLPSQFITVVPPQMLSGREWFLGTADAVYQNLTLIQRHRPGLVAVFGADHIYRMDVRQMVDFHHRKNAAVTVAALPVPIKESIAYGTLTTGTDSRVIEFKEKCLNPSPMPDNPALTLASMGNYLFETEVLVEALEEAHQRQEFDFGRHVLPRLLKNYPMHAYEFSRNIIPGIRPYEDSAYWRVVGSIESYFEAHQQTLGLQPRFDEFNPQWPIYSSNYQGPVSNVISGEVSNSLLGSGAVINGAQLSNSILRREVVVEPDAILEDCIIMDYVRIGAGSRLRRAIVDRHNCIAPGAEIGFDSAQDRHHYHVSETGIVVVAKGPISYYSRDARKYCQPGYEE
jgi:glucose-1-phosphate adenylyltransferase